MMMMSSWRQSCVQGSLCIMLGLPFGFSTPGILLQTVQKLLKFPFEVKHHCQQASHREPLTLTLFSCGSSQTDPQKGFLGRLPQGSQQSSTFHSQCYLLCFPKKQTANSGPSPKVQTTENSLLQLHQEEKQTKDLPSQSLIDTK